MTATLRWNRLSIAADGEEEFVSAVTEFFPQLLELPYDELEMDITKSKNISEDAFRSIAIKLVSGEVADKRILIRIPDAMERYFRHTLLTDYFADPFDGEQDALLLLSGSLSIDGVKQLRQRLEEVAREFDALLARDATLPAEDRVGVSLVLAQKPWLLQLFNPYRRSREA